VDAFISLATSRRNVPRRERCVRCVGVPPAEVVERELAALAGEASRIAL
jgi:hypothetical protein